MALSAKKRRLQLLLCSMLLFLTGCQRNTAASSSCYGENYSDLISTAQAKDEEIAEEAASEEQQQLAAVAEQAQITRTIKYTVEQDVLYCDGVAVTEDTRVFDFRDSEIADYSFMKNYTWIEDLLIEDNSLENLDFLRDCTNIKALSLTCAASDFQVLGKLSQLAFLDIHSPGLTDLSFLPQKSLDFLNCSYCNSLEDISGIEGMTSLSFLSLNQCSAIQDFSVLPSLTGLEQLALSGTTFHDLSLIEPLSRLSKLSIKGCSVDYKLFASATFSLKKLDSDADEATKDRMEELFPNCDFS